MLASSSQELVHLDKGKALCLNACHEEELTGRQQILCYVTSSEAFRQESLGPTVEQLDRLLLHE